MKLQKVAAIISAAALALTLTGCGNNSEINNALSNIAQNGQQSGTPFDSFASKPVESMPVESKPAVQLPDIPVNDASAFEYKFESELGGMVITDYKLQSPKVHIPDKLENEKVVGVHFGGVSKDITHIIMPDSVKEFRFSDQIKGVLQFVNIPNSVTELKPKEIDYYKTLGFFEGYSSLTSVITPDSVTEIGQKTFSGCTSLTSVSIGNGVISIDDSVFKDCTSLTSVTYNGKTYDNKHIDWLYDAINLGESGMLIEDGALKEVSRELTEVVIPSGVTKIDEWAFSGLSLETIAYNYLINGDIELEESVYSTNLTSVTIPDSVTVIGKEAFYYCTGLTSVTIGDGVTEIGASAFSGCTSLTSVTIPDSVTEIHAFAFIDCASLTSIDVADGNPEYCSLDGILFSKDKKTIIKHPQRKKSTSYTIPNGVTKIGSSAFDGCASLTSVTIPNSVTEIGDSAFSGCTSLTSVTIPDSVTKIADWRDPSFEDCENIKATYKGKTYDYEHIKDLYKAINGN